MKKPYMIVGGVLLLLISVLPLVFVTIISAQRTLTPLESTQFGILTFVLSTLGSALISAYYGRQQSDRNYVQLARPALRRVVALNRSVEQIMATLDEKQSSIKKADGQAPLERQVVIEWLDAISRLLQQHSGQLDAAISDWKEILPEEYAELQSISEIEQGIIARLEQIRVLNTESTEAAQKSIASLNAEVAHLQRKLEEQRSISNVAGLTGVHSTSLSDPSRIVVGRDFSVPDTSSIVIRGTIDEGR